MVIQILKWLNLFNEALKFRENILNVDFKHWRKWFNRLIYFLEKVLTNSFNFALTINYKKATVRFNNFNHKNKWKLFSIKKIDICKDIDLKNKIIFIFQKYSSCNMNYIIFATNHHKPHYFIMHFCQSHWHEFFYISNIIEFLFFVSK